MKRSLAYVFLFCSALTLPVQAQEAGVDAEVQVQQEQTEAGFFSRTWTNVKNFFAGDEAEDTASAETEVETDVQAGADAKQDESLVDKAADKTKAGVGWTADKAKQGAEWTKETAKDVTKATGKGVKKTGEAIEGLFPDKGDTTVDAEAQVDAEVENE